MPRNFYKFILSFCLLCFAVTAYCQQDCERKLEKGRVLFEKGYLEDIPGLLEPCVAEKGTLSLSNRKSALQLLTETFLFMGNDEKAEKYFEQLLKINPSFEPRLNTDHPELVYLSEKFSSKPKFSFGLKFGYNFPSVENKQTYFLEDSLSSTTDKYEGISNFQFGLQADINIRHSNFEISPEIIFTNIGYRLNTDMLYIEPGIEGDLAFEEHLKFVDFGLNLKYNFKDFSINFRPIHNNYSIKAKPYVLVGFSLNLLYKARMEDLNFNKIDVSNGIVFIDKEQSTGINLLEGSSPLRNKLNYSVNAAAGLKIILDDLYFVFFDFRYSKMLNSIVNSDNRYSNEILLRRFRHVDNDISFNSFIISIGIGVIINHSVKKIKP